MPGCKPRRFCSSAGIKMRFASSTSTSMTVLILSPLQYILEWGFKSALAHSKLSIQHSTLTYQIPILRHPIHRVGLAVLVGVAKELLDRERRQQQFVAHRRAGLHRLAAE